MSTFQISDFIGTINFLLYNSSPSAATLGVPTSSRLMAFVAGDGTGRPNRKCIFKWLLCGFLIISGFRKCKFKNSENPTAFRLERKS